MRRMFTLATALVGVGTVFGTLASITSAADSVTVQDYTPGTLSPATLNTTAYKDTSASKVQDFPRDTGGGTNKFARGLSNNSFAASTILPIGQGGGVTLKFQQPVNALADSREIGIFNGNFLTSAGGFFYGDMRGAILVSADNVTWRTLSGTAVADPLTYTASISAMNAPTMSYVWGTGTTAWAYPTGSGQPQSVLDTFGLANYEAPMPDDTLYNNAASTNGQRAALSGSSTPADYSAVFGTTAGGNWFDISATGLSQIQYLRINVASDATAALRLDSVFANANAVPEPAVLGLLGGVAMLLVRRGRRSSRVIAGAATAFVAASLLPTPAAQAQSFNDISFWTGTGTNRAALVVYWRAPEVLNNTSVPAPIATQTMIWGFRFNGTKTAEDLFTSVVAADPKLYAVDTGTTPYGVGVLGVGYDSNGNGQYGVTDGTTTYSQAAFTNHRLTANYGNIDSLKPTDAGDLYWGGGNGPSWELWNEAGDNGGFTTAPYRGTNPYFTSDGGYGGTHGQWDLASNGLSYLPITDGSWIGLSVAAGGLDYANPNAAGSIAYNTHKAAPPTVPEPAMIGMAGVLAMAGLRRVRR